MSLHGLPTLFLDVCGRRSDRLLAVVMLLLASVVATQLPLPAAALVIIVPVVAVTVGLGFLLIGWWGGPGRLARIAWQPDGRWMLSDVAGRTIETELAPGTRVTPFALWLEWKGRPGRPLLLLPGDVATTDFRRLVVRLRLSATPRRSPSP
jgi:hypothetical protein